MRTSDASRTADAAIVQTIDAVAEQLRARGERMTGPRRAVLTALAAAQGHLTAEEIVDLVSRSETGAHRASVYRTLEALADLGVVQHVHVGHGATAYHLLDEDGPHPHAQCRHCGDVYDLPAGFLDSVALKLVRSTGFLLDDEHVALSGICASCAAQAAQER